MPEATKLMKEFSGDIQNVTNWFGHLTGGEQDFILKTLAITATVGPALLIFGRMGRAVSDVGDLFLKSGKAMGMFKTEAVVAEAAKGAEAIGGAGGLEGALAGAVPEVGAAAVALGPLALGIGAVAAVGIGATLVVKHLSDEHKEAAKQANAHATAEATAAKAMTTTVGATQTATKLVSTYTSAQAEAKKKDDAAADAKMRLVDAQDRYNGTAAATSAALKKYGPDSDQYTNALIKEAEANTKLGQATDAWNKLAGTAKIAHDNVNNAAKNLNATYYTASQNTQKFSNDSDSLTRAKNKEKDAHQQVNNAALDYSATIKMFGPNSKAAEQASQQLIDKKNAETKAQQSVSWWTKQVLTDLTNEKNESDKLSSSIDNLASKNGKLTGILSKTSSGGKLPQFASGVQNFQGGLAIVGEEGPELAYLPQGTNVVPAGQTSQMMNGSSPGSSSTSSGSTITIQNLVVQAPNNATLQSILQSVDQDNLLVGRGMTPNRGSR
jgi:hypothetical protein